jgi:hypothetical protein
MHCAVATGRLTRLLACLWLCLPLLAGCYEASEEIIPATMAEPLPYGYSSINWQSGNNTELVRDSFGNDYRFQHTTSSEQQVGTMRGFRLYGDIFALQFRLDDAPDTYYIRFFAITGNSLQELDPDEAAIPSLAAQYGVTAGGDYADSMFLGGRREDILAFIRAHAGVSFH